MENVLNNRGTKMSYAFYFTNYKLKLLVLKNCQSMKKKLITLFIFVHFRKGQKYAHDVNEWEGDEERGCGRGG